MKKSMKYAVISMMAAGLLAACGGDVKVAIVAALAGVPPEVAAQRLAAAGGVVRAALAQVQG